MRWNLARYGLAAAAALSAAACDQLGQGPEKAVSTAPAPEPAAAPVDPQLRSRAGETYAAFSAAAGSHYTPSALGLSATDSARIERAMTVDTPSRVLSGGGADALVFQGCAQTGCGDGQGVVAIDLGTGETFVGVRDASGADILEPNDRLEALLRLNAPNRSWDDVPPTAPEPPARP